MMLQDTRPARLGRVWTGLVIVAVVACMGVPPARAETGDPCTYGGALALLEAAPVAATQASRSEEKGIRPHLGGLWDECQFRLYQDKETIPFQADDYILGGIAVWWTYDEMAQFGLSRAEAIEDLERVTDRIEIATVDGRGGRPRFAPVPVIVTTYRDAQLFGSQIVYNHRAFIAKLPAGEYLVRWTQSYPGFRDFVSTVRLLVTPA